MGTNDQLQSIRTFQLNSDCKFSFILDTNTNKIIPVLMITGITAEGENLTHIWEPSAESKIGIITAEFNNQTQSIDINITGPNEGDPITINPYTGIDEGDWLIITPQDIQKERYKMIYPRIIINSLGINTDSDSLMIKYYNPEITNSSLYTTLKLLQQYKDYSILTRALEKQYVLTLKNNIILKNNYIFNIEDNTINFEFKETPLNLNYTISNADVSIYLDAINVLKENAYPKVSYTVTPEIIKTDFINSIFNKMGYIASINDNDLKLKNIRGYVSGITLDLDNPDQDSLEIKNYKTKFEDLFSTITAQTEAMKKSTYSLDLISSAFTPSGDLTEEVLTSTIKKVDLNYSFNNGKLTINEKDGIWGTSENGVVAFRGGGIFTATERNSEGNWKWNTGITPQGINADLITGGQLDTNLVRIYAGDHLRFQMNGDGIFAYKTKISDAEGLVQHPYISDNRVDDGASLEAGEDIDAKQYVVFDENGLSLIAKKGALILNTEHTQYHQITSTDQIKRVEISWDGLILRNWENKKVFYADADTGDLTLNGRIEANSGYIGKWNLKDSRLWSESTVYKNDAGETEYTAYIALNAGGQYNQKIGEDQNGDILVNTSAYAFWAGDKNPEKAPFSIQKNGVIKASSGSIAGWSIQSNKLQSTYITLCKDTEGSETSDDDKNLAVLWINDGNLNHKNDLSYAKSIINNKGKVYATDFVLLTHNTNGSIKEEISILEKLDALEQMIQ